MSLRHWEEFEDVADHRTVCHKCLTPCPVDIDRAGTPGKGSTSKPRGLRTDNGRHIFFNYTSTVAALVGAGLRAGMDWHKD